jgi:two-component system, OmpR family, alkaline phosphatase synthesis response regulator PhoP
MAQAGDKTILVVDDEPNVRQYLQMILEDAGFNVDTAGDGEEALDKIKAKTPDYISLDLVMPRKSGRKLLYELKKSKEWSRIPVLIVTAHAKDEMGQGDLEDLLSNRAMSGPGVYLEKPIKPEAYVHCIQKALGVDETPIEENSATLRNELQAELSQASPEALKKALEALQKK